MFRSELAKPAILAVDDDAPVLAAVARDLRRRYGEDYRIVRAGSGDEALSALTALRERGESAAVLIADQRMPVMNGTEFLSGAKKIFPEAKTVLLTAYADTDAAIAAINEVKLDHYLLKPWDPPEDKLYPIVDDLLDDWLADHPTYVGIEVAGTRWSPATHEVKEFLARNQIPYRFVDIERDEAGRQRAEAAASTQPHQLPVVFFPDDTHLVAPDLRSLAAKAGLQTEAKNKLYDLVIIGGGPAGLAAGVYAASEGLSTAIIEKEATGGQAGTSSRIENYLGFPAGITGANLARRAAAQSRKFGAEILTAVEAAGVSVDGPVKIVTTTTGDELAARAVIIATGMTIKRLAAKGVDRLAGAGVYYGAAASEAVEYQGEPVFVVGGANSAGQAAVMLARFAGQVTMLVRGSSLEAGMSQYLVDQIRSTPNIAAMLETQVTEVRGEKRLEEIVLSRSGQTVVEPAEGLFIFIGAEPHSELVAGVVERDPKGFIRTGSDLKREGHWPATWTMDRDPYLLETSVPGVFAVGDVRSGVVRRVAAAVGQGAACVSFVHQYLASV
jgi:thioredoxin reductase (NADPH)